MMPKIEKKIHSNCSEWDELVISDEANKNYSERNYPEIEDIIKKVVKEHEAKGGWDR